MVAQYEASHSIYDALLVPLHISCLLLILRICRCVFLITIGLFMLLGARPLAVVEPPALSTIPKAIVPATWTAVIGSTATWAVPHGVLLAQHALTTERRTL